MPLTALDANAVARSLSQIADRRGDLADAYFEVLEEVMLPSNGDEAGVRARWEQGFAVRLVREGECWLAARDEIEGEHLVDALRQVARALPPASYPAPSLVAPTSAPALEISELLRFPPAVQRQIRLRHAGFPLRLEVYRHRRWSRVIGTQVAPEPQSESFYSCSAELPWGRYGTLLATVDEAAAVAVAGGLIGIFRAREAPPPGPHAGVTVLGPAATAVLLHEAVSHALETDTLALSGRADATPGVQLGSELLNVLDDPAGAPPGARRTCDDEGSPVLRRWLLRRGVVEQPLADLFAARSSAVLAPGAGRRGDRTLPPVPRSTCLELLAGESTEEDLLADAEGGLYLAEASRGALDPLSGRFTLDAPFARRIRSGVAGELVGPCRLTGSVGELLSAVTGVGSEPRPGGAGWCAKGGRKLPVWAKAPPIRLEGARIEG